jgi:hypothetical protein
MKRLIYVFAALLVYLAIGTRADCQVNNLPGKETDNTLSQKEIKEGWKLLFDGKTSTGWINAKTKKFPVSGWEIKNGTFTINPEAKGATGGGDIVTVDKYKNFLLSVDFMYVTGANSGIKYFIDTEIMALLLLSAVNTRFSMTKTIRMPNWVSQGTALCQAFMILLHLKTLRTMDLINGTLQR